MRVWGSFLLLGVLFAAGCGADNNPNPPGVTPSMLIENRSQYDLRELRIHSTPQYLDAVNLISSALAVDGKLLFYGEGEIYVTVYREKFHDGPVLAFTTARPFYLADDHGYLLEVFDESFRLDDSDYLDPKKADVPIIHGP